MAAAFPTSVVTDAILGLAANGAATTLNGGINNSVTTITVVDTTSFAASGYFTIDSEVCSYSSKNSTQFLGVTRGVDGTAAASHLTAAAVNGYIVAAHITNLQAEVKAIEADINARFGIGASSNKILVPVSVSFNVTGGAGIGTINTKSKLTVVDAASSGTTPGTNPVVWISGGTGAVNTLSEIGFTYGFAGAFAETYTPVTIGYQLSSGSGNTKGDIVMCTRNVTTDTAPTERLRVLAAGAVQLKYAPGSVSDGGLQMYDPTSQAAGVGAQINLGGCYTGTTTTQFGRIKASKLSSVDANLDTQMIFGVRSNGSGFVDVVTIDGNSQDVYTVAYVDYGGTSTIVGWSGFTKQNIYYKKIGRTVHVWYDLDGTSNSTSTTFTVPYPAVNTIESMFPCRARDNNADQAAPGVAQVSANSNVITVYKDWTFSSTSWTASARKIVEGYICYQTT